MPSGTVKNYLSERAYGFLTPDDRRRRFAGRSVEAKVCLEHAQHAETLAELERLRKLD